MANNRKNLLDKKVQQFKKDFKKVLGNQIRKPLTVSLGAILPDGSQAVIVPESQRDEPNEFYYTNFQNNNSRGKAKMQPGALPEDKIRFGTPVRIRRDELTGQWEIVGVDTAFYSQYYDGVPKAIQFLGYNNFKPGYIAATDPVSNRVLVKYALYRYNDRPYYIKDLLSPDITEEYTATNKARYVLIAVDVLNNQIVTKTGNEVDESVDLESAYDTDVSNNNNDLIPIPDNDYEFTAGYVKLLAGDTALTGASGTYYVNQKITQVDIINLKPFMNASGQYSFLISDGSTTETIENSDTLTVSGSNGASAVVSATDTLSIEVDINSLLEETGVDDAVDYIIFYDTSATSNKKITVENLFAAYSTAIEQASDPTSTDDTYDTGTIWINTSTDTAFICVDNTTGAAVWQEVGSGQALPLTTKGDLVTHDGSVNIRLPAGADGTILSANSAQTSGLEWVTAYSFNINDGLQSRTVDSGETINISNGTGIEAGVGGTQGAPSLRYNLNINLLTSESTVDGAADYVAVYDASVPGHRKVLIDNLPFLSGSSLTVEEEDGTPTGMPDTLRFSNDTVTDNGNGIFSVAIPGSINDLSDVDLSGISDNQAPVWNAATGQLEPGEVTSKRYEPVMFNGELLIFGNDMLSIGVD